MPAQSRALRNRSPSVQIGTFPPTGRFCGFFMPLHGTESYPAWQVDSERKPPSVRIVNLDRGTLHLASLFRMESLPTRAAAEQLKVSVQKLHRLAAAHHINPVF